MELGPEVLVVLPAFNEGQSVAAVIGEVLAVAPKVHVLVVDDGSSDETAARARAAGADVISNVFNVGVGGAMRVGFRYGAARGFRALVQVDADGQHDPRRPADSPRPTRRRAHAPGGHRRPLRRDGRIRGPAARRLAMRMLAAHLRAGRTSS